MSNGESLDGTGSLDHIWNTAVDDLSPGTRVWIYGTKPISLHNGILIVAVRDDLTRSQLESRVRPHLEASLGRALAQDIRLVVTIEPDMELPVPPNLNRETPRSVAPIDERDEDVEEMD